MTGRSVGRLPVAAPVGERGFLALARGIADVEQRYRWSVVTWVVACTALAALVVAVSPASFRASATLLLPPLPRPLSEQHTAAEAELLDDSRADSELQVIRSGVLLTKVFDALRLDAEPDIVDPPLQPGDRLRRLLRDLTVGGTGGVGTPDLRRRLALSTFASRVSVQRSGFSYVVEVTFTASDPVLARRVANALASTYVWQKLALKAADAEAGAEVVRPRIVALAAQASAAETAIAAAPLPAGALPDSDVRVIDPAADPIRQTGPRTGLTVAFGIVMGLLGGVSHAMADRAWSRRIRTTGDLARAVPLPCLGVVPLGGRPARAAADAEWGRISAAQVSSPFAVAIRHLRAAVRLGAPDGGMRTLALVAWTDGPAVGVLGGALAAVGRDDGGSIHLIEADPLGADGSAAALAEARRRGGEAVTILPALRTHPEAAAAAAAADGAAVVAVAGVSTADDVLAACRALRRLDATLLGTVLVPAERRASSDDR